MRLGFELAKAGEAQLSIFDVSGRPVASVFHGRREAGAFDLRWDGRDPAGRPVGEGIYFARRSGNEGSVMSRVVMLN